jgi:hypothetical protein
MKRPEPENRFGKVYENDYEKTNEKGKVIHLDDYWTLVAGMCIGSTGNGQ